MQIKTFRELQKELNRLYNELRPKNYDSKWTEKPEIRKKIDSLLDKKYVEVEDVGIKHIFINMENLTDNQQLKLWSNLWKFADKELPAKTNLMCFVVSKKIPGLNEFLSEKAKSQQNKPSTRKSSPSK